MCQRWATFPPICPTQGIDCLPSPPYLSCLRSLIWMNNDRGEIYVKSKTMAVGYFKDPEATASAFTSDGWFKTVITPPPPPPRLFSQKLTLACLWSVRVTSGCCSVLTRSQWSTGRRTYSNSLKVSGRTHPHRCCHIRASEALWMMLRR